MNVLSLKPGHDGCIAFVHNQKLVFSIEAEKDSFPRYGNATAQLMVEALEMAPALPDVLALGGWHKIFPSSDSVIGSGYFGLEDPIIRTGQLFGRPATIFSSSHERSHIFMAASMYPAAPVDECAVLVWEGRIGALYHWRDRGASITRYPVLTEPGARYSALFALAEPAFPEKGSNPNHEYAGKMMALASYDRDWNVTSEDRTVVECLLRESTFYPFDKKAYVGTSLYNCGVRLPSFHAAVRYMTDRLFEKFFRAAEESLPAGIPLLISGGCGLNCDWNRRWRETKFFREVFVPPVANDTGSAIGTASDAMTHFGAPCRLDWSVYSGADFRRDIDPVPAGWQRRPFNPASVVLRLIAGAVIPWVQGRCEIGPRALGNRSLLASPFGANVRARLNQIKEREDYRPIAPSCRSEELHEWFDPALDDPYMLSFSNVLTDRLPAITHVDGSARVHSVRKDLAPRLHLLLGEVRTQTGCGVLCNTSLNFKGLGFINRMSDLVRYCEEKGLDEFVVDDDWYTRPPVVS